MDGYVRGMRTGCVKKVKGRILCERMSSCVEGCQESVVKGASKHIRRDEMR